jgi:hypothetical protein
MRIYLTDAKRLPTLLFGEIFGHMAMFVLLAAATPTCLIATPFGQRFGLRSLSAIEYLEHKTSAVRVDGENRDKTVRTLTDDVGKCKKTAPRRNPEGLDGKWRDGREM